MPYEYKSAILNSFFEKISIHMENEIKHNQAVNNIFQTYLLVNNSISLDELHRKVDNIVSPLYYNSNTSPQKEFLEKDNINHYSNKFTNIQKHTSKISKTSLVGIIFTISLIIIMFIVSKTLSYFIPHYSQYKEVGYNKLYITYKDAIEKNKSLPSDIEFRIGYLYYYGLGVKLDNYSALDYFSRASKAGNKYAKYYLARSYLNGFGIDKNIEKAEQYIREISDWILFEANQNDEIIQEMLGYMYLCGMGVEKNYSKAFDWFKKSAEQGYCVAQYFIGKMYFYGYGVEQDYLEAFEWFKKSANLEYYEAQFSIGVLYYYGYGVEQDYLKAFEWYNKAAEQEYYRAQYSAGVLYYYGYGVEQDYTKAFELLKKSSDLEYDKGQYFVGKMYYYGYAVDQDYAKAFELFKQSADQGYSDAQFFLGKMYENGEGIKLDIGQAKYWYESASNSGNKEAKQKLEILN